MKTRSIFKFLSNKNQVCPLTPPNTEVGEQGLNQSLDEFSLDHNMIDQVISLSGSELTTPNISMSDTPISDLSSNDGQKEEITELRCLVISINSVKRNLEEQNLYYKDELNNKEQEVILLEKEINHLKTIIIHKDDIQQSFIVGIIAISVGVLLKLLMK